MWTTRLYHDDFCRILHRVRTDNQRRDRQSTLHWAVSRRFINKHQWAAYWCVVVPAEYGAYDWDVLPFRNSVCFGHTRPRRSNRLTKNEGASLLRLLDSLFHNHLEPSRGVDMESDRLACSDGHGGFRGGTCGSRSRWSRRSGNYPSNLEGRKEEGTDN